MNPRVRRTMRERQGSERSGTPSGLRHPEVRSGYSCPRSHCSADPPAVLAQGGRAYRRGMSTALGGMRALQRRSATLSGPSWMYVRERARLQRVCRETKEIKGVGIATEQKFRYRAESRGVHAMPEAQVSRGTSRVGLRIGAVFLSAERNVPEIL